MADYNAISEAAFIARYGALFEHSPWVVERAARARPFGDLYAALMQPVAEASLAEQLSLIRAHPELAGKAAIDRTLTEASTAEQASAGLDRLTAEEFDRFHALNAAYAKAHDMPFIICVRLTDKAGILAEMARRITQPTEAEIATAIAEIGKIVRLRLEELA